MAVWPVSMGGSYPGEPEPSKEAEPVKSTRQKSALVEPVAKAEGDE
jgi:hypothetical protein